LTEGPLTRLVRLAHRLHRVELGDGDERHLGRITPDPLRRPGNARLYLGQPVGDPAHAPSAPDRSVADHGKMSPARPRSSIASTSGRPITFEWEPSIASTNIPPRPWIA